MLTKWIAIEAAFGSALAMAEHLELAETVARSGGELARVTKLAQDAAALRDAAGSMLTECIDQACDQRHPWAVAVCVCGHPRNEHRFRGGAMACTVSTCACGPGCIHAGFVEKEQRQPAGVSQ